MFTEESSQQLTPLNEEYAAPPPPTAGSEHSIASDLKASPWSAPWLQVVRAILVWVSSVGLLLFVPVLVAAPYMIYRLVTAGPLSPEALASDKMLLFFSILGILPTHLLTLAITWMVITEGGRYPFWKTIGFEWPQNVSRVLVTLLSFLLALILLSLAYLVTNLYGGGKTQLDFLVESSLQARFATAFMAVVTAPLVEEVIYRGVLYPALERAAGVAIAIVIVSLLFAGVHVFQYYNNIAVITVITLLSLTLTVARAVTGKVLPSFIIHLVFNGIQSFVLVLAPFVQSDSAAGM